MLQIHEFWVNMFPIFSESYEFIYYIFDVFSIVVLLKILFELPAWILGYAGREHKW